MSTVPSAWSSAASASLTSPLWWLSDPLSGVDPVVCSVARGWKPKRHQAAGVFYPRGRSHAVVLTGDVYGIEADLAANVLNRTAAVALRSLLESGNTLLLRSPQAGDLWYLRVMGDVTESPVVAQPDAGEAWPVRYAFQVLVPVVEVDEPDLP